MTIQWTHTRETTVWDDSCFSAGPPHHGPRATHNGIIDYGQLNIIWQRKKKPTAVQVPVLSDGNTVYLNLFYACKCTYNVRFNIDNKTYNIIYNNIFIIYEILCIEMKLFDSMFNFTDNMHRKRYNKYIQYKFCHVI